MKRTIYLLVAYDGTDFHGWQFQHGVRTVQDVFEQAARRVARHLVDLLGCGRTDSGVHAAGHVSSFRTTCDMDVDSMKHALGSRLPKDVSLIALRHVQWTFDARRCALSKLYRYRIYNARSRPVEQFQQRYAYHFWQPLDVERMRAGARHLVGEQDFAAMAAKASERPSTVRNVLRCDVERHLNEIRIDVEGTGFLYKQVRNMVGTLINVGRGQWEPDRVAEILASRDRSQAGPAAPARGLCLQWVRYPVHLLRPPDDNEEAGAEPEVTPPESDDMPA